MTTTTPNTFNHECTFCGYEYKKPASDLVDKAQEFNVLFCGQCKGMETIRKGETYATVYQHAQ